MCELDFTSTPFCDTTTLTCEIDLPPSGKKIGFNLLDDKKFTFSYILDIIPNSPSGNKLPTQAKKNIWTISINVEGPVTSKG